MGLFNRKPSETAEQRYVQKALELRDSGASKEAEVARREVSRARGAAARAADHGTDVELFVTHDALKRAEDARVMADDNAAFWRWSRQQH